MANEESNLGVYIDVQTGSGQALEELGQLPGGVEAIVSDVNQALRTLGQGDPFQKVMADAQAGVASIDQIQAAAERAAAAVRLIGEANTQLAGAGSATRITGAGGTSLRDLQLQNEALQKQIALRQQAAELSATTAAPAYVDRDSAPGGRFYQSDAELAEQARQNEIAAARRTLIGAQTSRTPLQEDLTPFTKTPIDMSRDWAALEAQFTNGAAEFQGKSVIAVKEAFAGINGSIEPGFYNSKTGERLSNIDQAYYGMRNPAFNGSGGGGFFGGLGTSLTGGGGEGSSYETGQLVGNIAKYVLIYQVFRDIEKAVKDSVEQAQQFDRAVTDLSNRLQISKDEAQGLATQIGLVGAQGGLGPGQTVQEAATFAGAFQGQAGTGPLLTQGAQTATQIQVLTGNVKEDLPDTIAVIQAFNLKVGDTQRVLDAATSAAQNYGLANAHDILPGLAQIGDLATQSGFSLEQTANAIADIQTRTHDTSSAVAGQLQRFLGREGTPAFQQVFAQMGISSTEPFSEQLSQLSSQFDKLSDSQKGFITSEFGGGRAGVAALAFIEDYNRILGNTTKSLNDGGIAQKNYAARLGDIVGLITSIRGELKELAKDVGTSGLGAGFGIALEAAKPLLELLDEVVRLVNFLDSVGGHFTLGRDLVIGAAEIAGAVKLLGALNVGSVIGRITGRGSATSGPAGALTSSAVKIEAAGDEVAAALSGTAAKIAGGGTEVAAAETTAATETAAGGGVRGAIGGFFGRMPQGSGLGAYGVPLGLTAGGLLGAAASPLGIIGGALLTQQVYDAAHKLFPAIGAAQVAGQTAFQGPNDATSLQDRAQKLRESAQGALDGATGVFGTIENYVGAAEGRVGRALNIPFLRGENTETAGDAASRDRAYAGLLQIEAQRAQAAATSSAGQGDFADLIDLTKQGGVADGLKTLASMGLDAEQQLDALNQKLVEFAQAANGGGSYLSPGGAAKAAQDYANSVTNILVGTAAGHVAGGTASGPERSLAGSDFINNLAPGLNKAVNDQVAGALQGIQGRTITTGDEQNIERQTIDTIKRFLTAHGYSSDDIAKLLPDIRGAAGAAIQETLAQINADKGQPISPDAIGGIIAALPQLLSGTQQEVTNRALLGNTPAPQGAQVAGIQAALARAQKNYQSLSLSDKGPNRATDLQGVQDLIDGLRVQLQTAVASDLQASSDLAASLVSPFDAGGQLQAQLSGLTQQLAATKDPTARKEFQAKINQLNFQIAQQAVTDANAAEDATVGPGDSVGGAQAQYDDAIRTYNLIVSEGVTQGAAYSQALKGMNDARQAVIDAEVEQANALADSQIDPRNKGAVDAQNINDILAKLANTPRYGANGKQTSQYSQLVSQLNQARVQAEQDQVAQANAIADAAVNPQRPIMGLITQLQDARRQLSIELPGTAEYANTLKQIKSLQVQIAQAMTELGNARAVAGIDPRNTIALAVQAVANDRNVLHDDARYTTKYYQDLAQLHQDELTLAQDRTAKINAERDSNVRSGNELQAARAALADARRTLTDDEKGTAQYFQDLSALHQAAAAMAQSIAARAKQNYLLGHDTTDPVAQAQSDLVAAERQLREDQRRKTGDLGADRLGVEQAQWAKQKAVFDQRLSDQQNAYQLQDESTQQYLGWLEAQDHALRNQLAGMKKGSEGYRQLTDELSQVDQAIQSITGDMQGQFNLGDIKVPTVYDVRRSIAQSAQVIDASTTNNNVNINGVDMNAVINYINSILGPGATTRTPTANRKVHA